MAKNQDPVRDSEQSDEIATPTSDSVTEDVTREPATRDAEKAAPPLQRDAYDEVKHTRSATLWSGIVAGAIVLLLLLVFIVQNQQNTEINLIFWKTELPLGVSLLIAAIGGALLVGLTGALRIIQLRRAAKKLRH